MLKRKSTIFSPRTKLIRCHYFSVEDKSISLPTKVLVKIKCGVECFKCWLLYDTYQNALNFKNSKSRSSISSVFSGYCNCLPRGEIMKKILWSLEGTMCASSFCQSLAYPLHL